eukprot:TRINITY_DN4926_c0_g1_i1.p1 TRINITY_DN4926_c0_g1~~TRINITY_DN4926_c0_g1_i1.p1  ORF type:complete len:532 (-),score=75.25 TRINITY_DN4926_c0_g1_i1:31-1626(-)
MSSPMYHRRVFVNNNNNSFDNIVKISDEEYLEIKSLFKAHCRDGSTSVNVGELTNIWRDCVSHTLYDPLEVSEGSREVMNELTGGTNDELSFIEFMKVFKGKSVFINIAISNLREVVLAKVKEVISTRQNSQGGSSSSPSPKLPLLPIEIEGRDPALFVKEVDIDLCCSICMGVLVNPFDSPCSHSFCFSCINSALKKKSECPDCRTPLTVSELKPTSFRFKSMLGKLQTYCDNKSENEGCGWKGEWGMLDSHLQLECLYTVVDCSFNCGKSTQRFFLSKHQEECTFRPTTCEHCGRSFRVLDMDQHLQTCSAYPILCQCGETIARVNFHYHESEVCGETMVKCKFFQFGCSEIPRKDLHDHIENSQGQHIVHLLSYIEQNANQVNILREEVQSLQLELQTTQVALQTKEISQLKLAGDVKNLQDLVQGLITEQSRMNTSIQYLSRSESPSVVPQTSSPSESNSNYSLLVPILYHAPLPSTRGDLFLRDHQPHLTLFLQNPPPLFSPRNSTNSVLIKTTRYNNFHVILKFE